MNHYKQHPLSAAFPAMPQEDFETLVADIRAHGQRDAIVALGSDVLDGWHRFQACGIVGCQPLIKEFDGTDPRSFVLSRNLHRRHLTGSQRAAAVVACGNWKPAHRPGKGEPGSPLSNQQMAEQAQVSEKTIKQAKAAARAGILDKVASGEVTAKRGAEIAQLPKAQRQAAIADPAIKPKAAATPPAPEPPAAPPPAKAQPVGDLEAELAELREQYADLQQINERLEAMAGGEEETAKLIADLQKRLVRCQAFVKTVEGQRDIALNEASQLKAEVKRLRKEIAACKK